MLNIRVVPLFLVCSSVLLAEVPTEVAKMVNTYCSGCHNGTTKSLSNQLLPKFDPAADANSREWTSAYRQLQAGTMPPVGAPRPDRATYDRVLASLDEALGAKPKPQPASSAEIATRMARLLWNSAPDAALMADAQRNRLQDRATLEKEIRRMLGDDRAQAFITQFFAPWLQIDRLAKAEPNKAHFPDYEPSLRDAMSKETELFLLSQLREDRDPVELWSANYTFLNEQLAKHYDIPNLTGAQFRRVTLAKPERAGLLGQGSVLMVTSRHSGGTDIAFTTPAGRSIWVLSHFLGVPQPMPFPGARPVSPELPITPQTRALPAEPCVACHRNFFPLGYALENFDPIGRWRTQDQMGPVDATGKAVDGTPFNGVVELRKALLQRPDAFRNLITERLLTYSSGGKVGPGTPETLLRARQILSGMKQPKWSEIIAGVVQ